MGFTGIGSFAHLDYVKCLTTPTEAFDIAILGAPFDTAVSYRPGQCLSSELRSLNAVLMQ
jgi:agmatinase